MLNIDKDKQKRNFGLKKSNPNLSTINKKQIIQN